MRIALLLTHVLTLTTLVAQEQPFAHQTPLRAALNSDGSIKAGAKGSYTTRGYRMKLGANGTPLFVPTISTSTSESWDDQFYSNSPSSWVYAVCVSGSDVYIGGAFTSVNNIAANHVAKWNGSVWSALGTGGGNGVNSLVCAIAASGTNVYVGGTFSAANWGGSFINAYCIAMWNGSAWSNLSNGDGNGVNDVVYAISIVRNNVYVGGNITQANYLGSSPLAVNYVARWDGSNWNTVGTGGGNGVSGTVYCTAVSDTILYLGGDFVQANSGGTPVDAGRVVKWDGSNWEALGTGGGLGVNNTVLAIAASGSSVYVGGKFTEANSGGTPVAANYIARWNGSSWSALGSSGGYGMSSYVEAIAISGSDVYVGGMFSTANVGGSTVSVNEVARWNGSDWSDLGTSGGYGVTINEEVQAIGISGSNVYVGGRFSVANEGSNEVASSYFACWNGSSWGPVGASAGRGANNVVNAVAVSGNHVAVGGQFSTIGNVVSNYVAEWDGAGWNALGTSGGNGVNNVVRAIAVAGDTVYVGGDFTLANYHLFGSTAANHVARWDGTSWSSLGSDGNGLNGNVYAIAVSGPTVFVGGAFTQANVGGTTVATNHLARWNGSAWNYVGSALGNGANDNVYALALSGDDLYVGGAFTSVGGGVASNRVAKWNGSSWTSIGSGGGNGVSNDVYALAVSGSILYVGGLFTSANIGGSTVLANHVAQWSGSSWNMLGTVGSNGVDGQVTAFALLGTHLIVGGGFVTASAGGSTATANYVAEWDGSTWSALGTDGGKGLNWTVSGAAAAGSDMYIGGGFDIVNLGSPIVSHHLTKWIGPYLGPPAASLGKTLISGSGPVSFNEVGNETAIAITISSGVGSGNVSVYRYDDAPANSTGISGTTSSYRWIIQQLGLKSPFSGEIRFKLSQIPSNGISGASSVVVYSRATPGTGAFSAASTTYDSGNDELVASGVTGFGEFVFGSSSDPLSVQIKEFIAKSQVTGVELKWSTFTENNSYGFDVERRCIPPADKVDIDSASPWLNVGFVPSAGTSSSLREYSFKERNITPGRYAYRLKQIDNSGTSRYVGNVEVEVGLAPKEFTLNQNYPNPFNPSTTIQYGLPTRSRVRLQVYNILGQIVADLVNTEQAAGWNQIVWNANVTSGLYFYRLEAVSLENPTKRFVDVKKMVLLK